MNLSLKIFNLVFYIAVDYSYFKKDSFAFGLDFLSFKDNQYNRTENFNMWLGLISFHFGVIR